MGAACEGDDEEGEKEIFHRESPLTIGSFREYETSDEDGMEEGVSLAR